MPKRPDKYTTGFFNASIDCFANSTLQSLAALPQLNVYLNTITTLELPPNETLPELALHQIMIKTLSQLQSTIYHSESISVWEVLHVLEKIHKAKFSRIQHDAHELLQLILETLHREYELIGKVYDGELPQFPFQSETESKLRCMKCRFTSLKHESPMNIVSINVPHGESSATLDQMLRNNQSEVIEGYCCFVCMATYLCQTIDKVGVDASHKVKMDDEEEAFVKQQVIPKLLSKELYINDELGEDGLFASIKSKNPFLVEIGKGVVHREVRISSIPKILPIHLSRSMFDGSQAMRNPCHVEFKEDLKLNSNETVVRYQLKSVIKHTGSHSSGHYECYRHKPKFYKTAQGEYYNNIPAMTVSSSIANDTVSPDAPSLIEKGMVDSTTSPSELDETEQEDHHATESLAEFRDSARSRRRSSLSSGLGSIKYRMSSIIGVSSNNSDSIPEASNNTASDAGSPSPLTLPATQPRRRDKLVASVAKKPYWRISDTKVSEANSETVLSDGKAAYMLIYEMA